MAFVYLIPTPNDPYFSSVSLLLHMNGTNGGTTFTDQKGGTVTRTGAITTSTTQIKYGTASATFDGSSRLMIGNTGQVNFGSGDFTMEGWIYPTSYRSGVSVFGDRNGPGGTSINTILGSNGSIQFNMWGDNTDSLVTTVTTPASVVSLNAWTHVAIVRRSRAVVIYINGVKQAGINFIGTIFNGTNSIYIGGHNYAAAFDATTAFQGFIDDVRITKGVGRYLKNFTPSAAQFQDA